MNFARLLVITAAILWTTYKGPLAVAELTNHFRVVATGAGSGGIYAGTEGTSYNLQMTGYSVSVSADGVGTGNARQVVSSSASLATAAGEPFRMRLSAEATNSSGALFVPAATAWAFAEWQDVMYFGRLNPPKSIRLMFGVDGQLTCDLERRAYAGFYSAATFSPPTDGFIGSFPFTYNDYWNNFYWTNTAAQISRGSFETWGWGSLLYAPEIGQLHGTFYVNVPFNQEIGGYFWSLTLGVRASVYDEGAASALFGHTVTFQAVTDLDGVPFDPALLSFDSGVSPVAVPEPSTYAMALAGLACGAFSMFPRRKA